MNTVYILGAGASHDLRVQFNTIDAGYGTITTKDVAARGPLSGGYFYYFDRLHKAVKSAISPSLCREVKASDALVKHVCDKYGISASDLLENKRVSQRVNIENLYIDIESTRGGDPHDLKNYIYSTLSFVDYYCISKLHHVFAEYLISTDANVISFNWDTLIDDALYYTNNWAYGTGYGIDFEKVVYKDGKMPAHSCDTKNIILKPHGSINWYSDINKEKLYLVIPVGRKLRGGTFGQLGPCESIGSEYVHSYIVSPGEKRKQFPAIWNRMRSLLESADKIIAIGFSFNSNDGHIKEEFDRIDFKKDISVEIIDPNGGVLVDNFKKVFKTDNVTVAFKSFADYCDNLKIATKESC